MTKKVSEEKGLDKVNGLVEVQVGNKDKNRQAKIEDPKKIWFKLFLRVFVALVIFFFAIFFTWYAVFLSSHNYYSVKGASMVPTLNEEIPETKFNDAQGISYDCVYVDNKTEAKLFDVIVINTHQTIVENGNKMTKTLIKRLMAKGGDYVTLAKTKDESGTERISFFRIPGEELPKDVHSPEFLNFEIVDEDWKLDENGENGYKIYQPDAIWTHKVYFEQPLTATIDLEVEGVEFDENREYEFNFVTTYFQDFSKEKVDSGDFIISKSGLVYVKVPEGKFFYMGDNRAFSSDSREDCFRNLDDIVGPVEIVIYNNGLFTRIGTFLNYFFQEVEKFFAR